MRTLSSEVAKPEPAVMPLVAKMVLEYAPSTPTVRRSQKAAKLNMEIVNMEIVNTS